MTITRRTALGLSISAFLSGLSVKANARELAGTKVIVIGAGIAGLAAAKDLQAYGAEVVVLEAGNYVGGRIRTDRSLGAPFEYGASWIHGPSRRNPIQRLARQMDADTFVTDDDSLEIFDGQGQPISEQGYVRLNELYARLEALVESRVSRSDTRSLKQVVLDQDPEILKDPLGRWMLSAYIEFEIGAGIENISAANMFSDSAFAGDDVIFIKGYDEILAPLIDKLDIRLNTAVSRVSYSDDGVNVDGLDADYVVCTVPLGVLKAQNITFDPALPVHIRNAINEIGFGSVTKIALKFDEPFWDTSTQYFGMKTEELGRWNYWLNYRTFSEENILLGLSFGRYAPIADRMSREEMTRDALEVLRTAWGDEVQTPRAVKTTHWSAEPNFLGAYSYPQAGGTVAQYEAFKTPISDRLFIAGEHTDFAYHSSTHGALMSGRRAAEAILES